ncbi:DUF5654 family protein [Candidatus Parcubacteria bacterium]|nr:DUF5654 family protein [Candidatus Parcubacteria bacterium]
MNKELKLEILEKMSTLVTAGFGLVAALAWNEAIKKLFETIFGKQSNLIAMFGYAIIVTVIVVLATVKLGRLVNKVKEELNKEEKKELDELCEEREKVNKVNK